MSRICGLPTFISTESITPNAEGNSHYQVSTRKAALSSLSREGIEQVSQDGICWWSDLVRGVERGLLRLVQKQGGRFHFHSAALNPAGIRRLSGIRIGLR